MHLRKLVLACGFASFALSNYASALGLGEVKLKSTLNQPLSAEVRLLDTKGLSPEQIDVNPVVVVTIGNCVIVTV